MKIAFQKLHGAGNDFIIVKYKDFPYEESFSQLAIQSCHRRFGIGADGLMIVGDSKEADFKMYFYNGDGSIANMCGNGIRCFAKSVYDEGLINNKIFDIETLAGIKTATIIEKEGKAHTVKINMGKMVFKPSEVPIKTQETKEFINKELVIEGKTFNISTVLMGVPHTVIFTDHLDLEIIKKFGPLIEKFHLFPDGTNVNFAKVQTRDHVEVRTWERGAGYTLACGTGVTSVCGVGRYLNLVEDEVKVGTEGGSLKITIHNDFDMDMEGSAQKICQGTYFFNNLQ
ncbi:MAG: diaminopimelate epimerase [Clostridiaceae bacterium]|nr:diaminopimelate epimerase [Clostridiaceae bacterium]